MECEHCGEVFYMDEVAERMKKMDDNARNFC